MRPRIKQHVLAARTAKTADEAPYTPEAFADAVAFTREQYTAHMRRLGYSLKALQWRSPPPAVPEPPFILIIKRGARS